MATGELTEAMLSAFQVVVLIDAPLNLQVSVDMVVHIAFARMGDSKEFGQKFPRGSGLGLAVQRSWSDLICS